MVRAWFSSTTWRQIAQLASVSRPLSTVIDAKSFASRSFRSRSEERIRAGARETRHKALVRINSKRRVPLYAGTKLVLDGKGECDKDGVESQLESSSKTRDLTMCAALSLDAGKTRGK